MERERKIKTFLRNNAVYLLLAFCIMAIGLTVMLVLLNGEKNAVTIDDGYRISESAKENITSPIDEGNTIIETPVDTEITPTEPKILFISPIANYSDVHEYSDTMVFNSTLKRYSSHTATDYFAEEGTNVLAVYDGKVIATDYSLLQGYTVTVDHGNGLKTVYNSLSDCESVKVGQVVKQGDVIGHVSVSNRQEYGDGAHLHFEVVKDGVSVSPVGYFETDDK
ncbi:MAG: M23 family metallopeptidase [Clostridia bacterium]|nr:M23 family metallopeptidase [Clostridia bacterium]